MEAYSAFWRLVRFDGMGGTYLPYESTVAWCDEQEVPMQDRETYRRLWDALLSEVRKDRGEQREKERQESSKGSPPPRRSARTARTRRR